MGLVSNRNKGSEWVWKRDWWRAGANDEKEKKKYLGVEERILSTLYTSGRHKPACVPVDAPSSTDLTCPHSAPSLTHHALLLTPSFFFSSINLEKGVKAKHINIHCIFTYRIYIWINVHVHFSDKDFNDIDTCIRYNYSNNEYTHFIQKYGILTLCILNFYFFLSFTWVLKVYCDDLCASQWKDCFYVRYTWLSDRLIYQIILQ